MKSSNPILLIGLSGAFLFGCSGSGSDIAGPDNIPYVRESSHVAIGDTFEISERVCVCTPYHLEMLGIWNEDCIDLVEYSEESSGSPDPGFVGGSTRYTWKYLAAKSGLVICQLGWVSERSGTAKIKTYYILIKGGG